MEKTISVKMEHGRMIFHSALNQAIKETQLPACLIEGLILDLLAETRAQKTAELSIQLLQKQEGGPEND